jgi:nitrite reductase (NADH) small subunit
MSRTGPTRWPVARAAELPPGARTVVQVAGKPVGVFNVNGTFVAILDVCPHELIPICAGRVGGTTLPGAPGEWRWGREGEILACPMHGWEFDLLTGKALAHKRKHLKRYPIAEEDGVLYVTA